MRILYYLPLLSMGGTERQLFNLVANIDRQRFEPVVWAVEDGPVAGMLRGVGVSVHLWAVEDPRELERVVCWIRSLDAPIFHSWSYGDEWRDIVLARLAGIPLCFSRRGNLRHWDPESAVDFPETLRNVGSDLVIANSQAVANYCQRMEHIRPEKIRVIHNGIAPREGLDREAARAALGLTGGDLVAGNVANLRPVKGHRDLLVAFREVAACIPHAKLILCGEGTMRADLERLRDQFGLGDRVILTGFLPDAEALYSALDIYVSSSLSEGMSNAILEAMHAGLPVAATAVGGTPESVIDGVTGLLAPPGEPNALAAAMTRLLGDPSLRERMGQEGGALACLRFSIPGMVRQYEALYLEELGRRGLR